MTAERNSGIARRAPTSRHLPRRVRPGALLLAAAIAASLFTAPAARAYVLWGIMSRWHTQTYWVNPNFTDIRSGTAAQQIAAVQNGANDWNGVADYLWTYGGQTNVATVNGADGINAVFYVPNSQDSQFGALAICFAQADANNFITGFDIQFYDKNPTWDFLYYGQGGTPPTTDFDIWGITSHELGHALGMWHTNLTDPTVTMYYQTAPGDISHRGLHTDDIAGIQAIYGPGPYTPKFAGVQVACGPAQNVNAGVMTTLAGAWMITNTGNIPDAFNYQLNDIQGWIIPAAGQTPLLQPGALFQLAPPPAVNPPANTPNGTIDNLTFTAMSTANPAVTGGCVTPVTALNPAYVGMAQLGGPPSGLAFDIAGNLYVAVFTTGMVMQVPPGGGAAAPVIAGLAQPTAVVFGPNGNLFVADLTGAVREYALPAGNLVSTPAPPGTFAQPMDLAFCGNDLLVADTGPNNVYILVGAAGGVPPGPLTPVLYSGPYPDLFGILVDPNGNLIATGGTTGNVYRTPPGVTIPVPWGNTVGGFAMGVAMDAGGFVYVAEGQVGGDIDVFLPGGGVPAMTIPASTSGWTWLVFSRTMQAHPPNVNDSFLFTSNTANVGPPNVAAMNVLKFDVAVAVGGFNGLVIPNTSTCPVGPVPVIYAAAPVINGQGPSGLAFDPGGSGQLFLADYNAGTIQRIPPGGGGAVPVAAGLVTPRGITARAPFIYVAQGDGSISERQMAGPFTRLIAPPGTFVDPVDMAWCGRDLFVTDRGAKALYVIINAAGPTPNAPLVYQAGFPDLFGVAISPTGQVYVTLNNSPQVARLNAGPGSGWTAVAGRPGAMSMQGISFDARGNYVVADGLKGDVYQFGPGGGLPVTIAMNACSGETWTAYGIGVTNPGLPDPEVYYTSTGAAGPLNTQRLTVSRLNFTTGAGKRLPDLACGTTSGVDDFAWDAAFGSGPLATAILQNSPNPVRRATRILYALETSGPVRLSIHDMTGRLVRTLVNATAAPGRYAVSWDGTGEGGRRVAAGIYAYLLEAGGKITAKKMVVVAP